MLQAWNVARRHGRDRPEWLACCRRYGNWLVQAQNADGSYFREYGFGGLPIERSKDTTDQAIRFLSDLFLVTGEPHFREMSRMLLHDAKQLLDWDDTLGYAYPGLQTEALSLPPRRGHGVTHWLPWLTVTQLEPLVSLKEVFGNYHIDAIQKLPQAEQLRRNAQFSKMRGFVLKLIP